MVVARTAWWRTRSGALAGWFCRAGTRLLHDGVGFEASAPVTMRMDGSAGAVLAVDAVEIVLRRPAITAVHVDGAHAAPIARGDGWIAIRIAAGAHALAIEAEPRRGEDAP